MFRFIGGTYSLADKDCAELLQTIPILHLHGQLVPLNGDNSRSYEAITEPDPIVSQAGADSIRIIHEDISQDPVFEEARKLLSEASTICFLGFGYDETNLDRLRISALGASNPMVYGTAFQVPEGERDAIIAKFQLFNHGITLGTAGQDCLKFVGASVAPRNR